MKARTSTASSKELTQAQPASALASRTRVKTKETNSGEKTKPTSAAAANPSVKKKRTEIAIETRRQTNTQQSQPLFLRTARAEKENTKSTLFSSNTSKQALNAQSKGLKDLIHSKCTKTALKGSSQTTLQSARGVLSGFPKTNQITTRQKVAQASPKVTAASPRTTISMKKPPRPETCDTKTMQTEAEDEDKRTEHAQFVSKKNPHEIIRSIQKKERLFMFATYDHLADPSVFRQVLQQLPTEKTFPQEMCQLVVKDFELCFSKDPNLVDQDDRRRGNGAVEYQNPDESPVPDEAPEVMPFVRRVKNKVLFVQAYLLPLQQLLELLCHLTHMSPHELQIPERFSFRQPLRLLTPRNSFYNCLTKISPFEQLDVLCLTREDIQAAGVPQKCMQGVIPPKQLVHTLFRTYSNVFRINQTEHTLLYYLYQLEQINQNYNIIDIVQVVASDLFKQAHCMKQEEPTIVDEHHQLTPSVEEAHPPQSYERIDSPNPAQQKQNSAKGGVPFRISLLEMPIDPGSAEKDPQNQQSEQQLKQQQQSTLDYQANPSKFKLNNPQTKHQRRSMNSLNNSYLMSAHKSQASINMNNQSREQIQEALSMASEKKFGLGGNIITGLMKPGQFGSGGAFGSFSRNSLTQSNYDGTNQSDLTAFGNCPFNASNLSLSVYGDKSIIGGQGVYGRGAFAMMNNLQSASPKKPPMVGVDQQTNNGSSSPYGRPSLESIQMGPLRRNTNKY